MFDINSFIRMDRIVLFREVEMKTLDLVSTIQAARNFVFIMLWTIHKQMAASILCSHESILVMFYKIIPISEQ
jgi:hypothetical protein